MSTTRTLDPPPVVATGTRSGTRRLPRPLRSPGLLLAWVVIGLAVLSAIVPGLFSHQNPVVGDSDEAFLPPGPGHWFGTDQLGRDMFSRIVHGSSTTLTATLYAVAVAFVVGGFVGLVSGYVGGRFEGFVMRIVDVLLSVPSLLLCMVIVAALGYGTMNVALAVGIASIASFARVMRSEVIKVVRSDHVEAARGLGADWPRIVFLHVLPNAIAPLVALVALEFGTALLAVAALGFLGYGAPPPTPEWGLAVTEGRTFLATYPWLALIPGAVIAVVVLSTNRISRSFARRQP